MPLVMRLLTSLIVALSITQALGAQRSSSGNTTLSQCRSRLHRKLADPNAEPRSQRRPTLPYVVGVASRPSPKGTPRDLYRAPHRVIYSDEWWYPDFPAAGQMGGFNRFIFHVYLTNTVDWPAKAGAMDVLEQWIQLDPAVRKAHLDDYHAHGIAVMVGLFGSVDLPTTKWVDAKAFAKEVAEFTEKWEFDGVDVDYEDMPAAYGGTSLPWVTDLHRELRGYLPDHLISHAPIAPWFTTADNTTGFYRTFDKIDGDTVDFYNIQYYNQQEHYDTCETVVTNSTSTGFPGTALGEIQKSGVPWERLVLGKPLVEEAAYTGYMSPVDVAKCYADMKALGGSNVMFWQWLMDSDAPQILKTVLGE